MTSKTPMKECDRGHSFDGSHCVECVVDDYLDDGCPKCRSKRSWFQVNAEEHSDGLWITTMCSACGSGRTTVIPDNGCAGDH